MRVTGTGDDQEPRDSISHDWMARISQWGMAPLLVPNLGRAAAAFVHEIGPDLVVLTGGEDLGATPERDETESALLDYALARRLSVLGVCRGLQVINNYFRGRLVPVAGHAGKPHAVTVAAPWHEFYGPSATVNSFHDQGIPADGVGDGLIVTATDPDGHVEGFCHPERPLAAIMWHPERDGGLHGDRVLLAALAEGGIPWR